VEKGLRFSKKEKAKNSTTLSEDITWEKGIEKTTLTFQKIYTLYKEKKQYGKRQYLSEDKGTCSGRWGGIKGTNRNGQRKDAKVGLKLLLVRKTQEQNFFR